MGSSALEIHRRVIAELTAPGAPFEVVAAEVAGRPTRLFRHAVDNFTDLITAAERQFADREFIVEDGDVQTLGQVVAASRPLAAALQQMFNVRPGDRVGIAMRNRWENFAALFAAAQVGAVATCLNSRGSPDELAASEAELGCTVVVADTPRAARLREGGSSTPIILVSRDEAPGAIEGAEDFVELVAAHRPISSPVRVGPDDPLWVLFTSGTSGRPKGATLTHRNIANVAMTGALTVAAAMRLIAEQHGVDLEELRRSAPPPSSLHIFPLFHVSGLLAMSSAMQTGGRLVLMRRWNAEAAASLIAKHQISTLMAPPMVLSDLLDLPDSGARLAGLRTLATGGQAMPTSLRRRLGETLPAASFGTGWGMTEACGAVTTASGALLAMRADSAGIAGPVVDVRAVTEAGEEAPRGVAGELQVRGALTMKGYWNRPDADAEAFDGEWYRSGDLGYFDDDGFVFIVGRMKDMVISAGENIYCAEIERVLSAHPLIGEVAVFGAPDPRLGEKAIAAVGLRPGAVLTEDEIKDFARSKLADYKVPASVVFGLAPLPRNPAGKVDKAKLSAMHLGATAPA